MKNTSSPLFKFVCYSESFISVFMRRNKPPESPQLDIEL